MAFEVIYFYNIRTKRGIRKQLRGMIAHDSQVNNRNRATAPAGAFEEIPDDAISISDPSQEGYAGGMAIGTPDPSTRSITFHLDKLTGTTNLDNLRTAVVEYEKANGGSLYLGTDGTVTFTTSNVFWILTDEGDPANTDAMGDPTIVEFIGVQRPVPGGEGRLKVGIGGSLTFNLVHIVTAVFTTVEMSWVSKVVRGFISHTAPFASGEFGDVVDIAFELSGRRWYISHRADRINGASASFYQTEALWTAIQHCADGVYKQYMRTSGGLGAFVFKSAHALDSAGVFDHWKFYKQNYGANHQRGTLLARDEIALMGEIRANPTDEPFAGLLRPGQDSLQGAFARLGDFLKNAVESAIARGTINLSNGLTPTINFIFYRLLDSATPIQLSVDDILIDGNGEREIIYTISSNIIRGVKVARRGKQGNSDQDSWHFKFDGATEEGAWNHKMIFDTNPALAETNEYTGYTSESIAGGPTDVGLFDSFPGGSTHNYWLEIDRYYPWKLYYLDQPLGAAGAVPFRVHEVCEIEMGNGENVDGELDALTTLEWPDAIGFGSLWWKEWRNRMRGKISASIANNGMTYAAARALNYAFGRVDLVSYDFSAFSTLVKPSRVGDAYLLPDDGTGTLWTANGLLGTGETYMSIPGWCIMVDCQPNEKEGIAKCTLQGLRKE